MTKHNGPDEKPNDIQILDDLIDKYYQKIKNEEIKDVKVGELLKMIEIKRKLSPEGKEQKEFWKMIDNIRQESNKKFQQKAKAKTKTKAKAKAKAKATKRTKE